AHFFQHHSRARLLVASRRLGAFHRPEALALWTDVLIERIAHRKRHPVRPPASAFSAGCGQMTGEIVTIARQWGKLEDEQTPAFLQAQAGAIEEVGECRVAPGIASAPDARLTAIEPNAAQPQIPLARIAPSIEPLDVMRADACWLGDLALYDGRANSSGAVPSRRPNSLPRRLRTSRPPQLTHRDRIGDAIAARGPVIETGERGKIAVPGRAANAAWIAFIRHAPKFEVGDVVILGLVPCSGRLESLEEGKPVRNGVRILALRMFRATELL